MMAITDGDLRLIRAEIGSTPSDDDLADWWDQIDAEQPAGGVVWQMIAVQILSARLADQQSGALAVSIPGAISVSTSAGDVAYLRAQIQRLQAGVTGVGAGGRVVPASRRSRIDFPVFPPRF